MSVDMVFKVVSGSELLQLKDSIDLLYSTNRSVARARETDVFFLALHDSKIVGAVRFCVEEGTNLLRSMMIDANHRGTGIGARLLCLASDYLQENSIHQIYGLPYPHLEHFYSKIGFYKIAAESVPGFLQKRMAQYLENDSQTICMKRD